MNDGRAGIARVVAPILLAALTVAVFSKLQYYGPESTLRRFHAAALQGDVATMDATTVQGAGSSDVQKLAQYVRYLAQSGYAPQPLSMDRRPGLARCDVAYVDPMIRGVLDHIFWRLVLYGHTWKIDATQTLASS